MTKKRCCSICHNEGHNSRTCNVRDPPEDNAAPEATSEDNYSGLQLNLALGRGSSTDVLASSQQPQPLEDNAAPEATSEDNHSGLQLNLTLSRGSSTGGSASSQQPQPPELAPASNNNSREVQINKGVRWSPEEHLGFLKGIRILGNGAWKAISNSYVQTRTANQISSHAQKYFKRTKNPLRRKRNPSIFDIGMDEIPHHPCIPYIQRLCQISRHRRLQPNNRLLPLPPSPNPRTMESLTGFDRPSSGHGDMQIDEGKSSKAG